MVYGWRGGMLEQFFEIQTRMAAGVGSGFKRFLFDRIDWSTRLFALVGARGVGKTTMLLQRLLESRDPPGECLYLSADNIRVQALGLYEVASEFFRTGGKELLIDEAHKYPGWAQEVKNVYDSFPKSRMCVSGSSTLEILAGRTDLSRRLVVYKLPGLSFREFLSLETGARLASIGLKDLLSDHMRLAPPLIAEAGGTILGRFKQYLRHGCYPFYLESRDLFAVKLAAVVEKVVSDDIPAVFGVRPSSVPVLRKLLHLVASSQPFVPNIERMAGNLGISKEYVYSYLDYLRRAGLFSFLASDARGFKALRKPAKVYLDNPNLFAAILDEVALSSQVGAVRESFFLNQMSPVVPVEADPQLDFRTADGVGFEVGGRSKGTPRRRGTDDGWVASDGLEVGAGRRIPLWMFGFLY
jgi:predicted AAA+ superfamily ATPase